MDTRTVQTGKTGFSVCGFTTRSFEEGFFLRSFPDTAGVFPKIASQKDFRGEHHYRLYFWEHDRIIGNTGRNAGVFIVSLSGTSRESHFRAVPRRRPFTNQSPPHPPQHAAAIVALLYLF